MSFSISRFYNLLVDELTELEKRGKIYSFHTSRRNGINYTAVHLAMRSDGSRRIATYTMSDTEIEQLNMSLQEIAGFIVLKLVEKIDAPERLAAQRKD